MSGEQVRKFSSSNERDAAPGAREAFVASCMSIQEPSVGHQFRTPASHSGSSSRGPSNVSWSASSSIHTASSIGSTPSVSTLDTTSSTQASAGTRRFHFSDVDNFNPSVEEWEDLNQVLLDPEDDSPDTKIAMAEAQSERSKGSHGEILTADTSFYGIMTTSLDDVARPRTSSAAPTNPFPFRIARASAGSSDGRFAGQDYDNDLSTSAANSSGNSGNSSGSRGSLGHPRVDSPYGATPPPAVSDGLSPLAPDAWKSRLNRLTPSHIPLQPDPGMKDHFVPPQGGFAKGSPDSILDRYPSPAEASLPLGMDQHNADNLGAKKEPSARSRKGTSQRRASGNTGVKSHEKATPEIETNGSSTLHTSGGVSAPPSPKHSRAKRPAKKRQTNPAEAGATKASHMGKAPAILPFIRNLVVAQESGGDKHIANAASNESLVEGSDKWFQREEEKLRSGYRDLGIGLTLRLEISAVNHKLDVVFRMGMAKKAAAFSRSEIFRRTLQAGTRNLKRHQINVIETRTNGQGGERAASSIFGKPITSHIMVLSKDGQAIGPKNVGVKIVFRFYKEEATEGKDEAGKPRMEYLVQITGGGKFASAEDVQDLVADIFGSFGVVASDVVIRSSTFSATNKDTFGQGISLNIAKISEKIKTKYDDVKIIAVTGAVSFAIADPKCKPQLQKTGTIYMPFCNDPRRVRLECLSFLLSSCDAISLGHGCDSDSDDADQNIAVAGNATGSQKSPRTMRSEARESRTAPAESGPVMLASSSDVYTAVRNKRKAPGPDSFVPIDDPESILSRRNRRKL